jgi:hypothetical protein
VREVDDADDVKVLVETLPEGVRIEDGTLVVDPARYELRGTVYETYNKPLTANFGLWPYAYKRGDQWRHALCTWQLPLTWFTVTLWAWISPTYWPCHVTYGDEADRRATMVRNMQRGTKLAGGDVLIVAGFGGYDFVKATVSTDPKAPRQSGDYSLVGKGYALKTRTPAP